MLIELSTISCSGAKQPCYNLITIVLQSVVIQSKIHTRNLLKSYSRVRKWVKPPSTDNYAFFRRPLTKLACFSDLLAKLTFLWSFYDILATFAPFSWSLDEIRVFSQSFKKFAFFCDPLTKFMYFLQFLEKKKFAFFSAMLWEIWAFSAIYWPNSCVFLYALKKFEFLRF